MKPGLKRKPIKHGTASGYSSHYYHKELPPCEPCKQASLEENKKFKLRNPGYAKRKWKEFKERNPNYKKDYHKANPEQTRKDARIRRAKIRGVESEPYTEAEVLNLYGFYCYLCNDLIDLNAPKKQGIDGWEKGLHLDHLIPITFGGSNKIDNVRPTHALCNLQKGVRWNTQGKN